MLDYTEFAEKLRSAFALNKLSAMVDADEVVQKFYKLTELLTSVGETTNLTAIRDIDGIILKHYIDSLTDETMFSRGSSVIDIGCGPGFPSLPLAIVRSDLKLTALDSTAKKIDFTKLAAKELKLDNLSPIVGRAEELAHADSRECFDFATARAVARLNILCELSLPFIKPGGKFIALKSKDAEEEIAECTTSKKSDKKDCLSLLGGRLSEVRRTTLVGAKESLERVAVVIEKRSPTPAKYPRAYAKIKKSPL